MTETKTYRILDDETDREEHAARIERVLYTPTSENAAAEAMVWEIADQTGVDMRAFILAVLDADRAVRESTGSIGL